MNPPDKHQQDMAALAASALVFRRNAADALDAMIVDAIRDNLDFSMGEFTTQGGRECRIILAVGGDAASDADDIYAEISGDDDLLDDE